MAVRKIAKEKDIVKRRAHSARSKPNSWKGMSRVQKIKMGAGATSGFRKTKKAAGKRTRQEIYDEADFKAAKRRGSGIFTPKEQKRIDIWKAAKKEHDRNKKVQSNRVKKASKRTVKRSKGYA